MNADVTARIESLLAPGIEDGSFPGAQVYASVRGEVVADVAMGEARLGAPMAADTIVSWQCTTKPVTAVAVCQLWERGRLDLDAPVVQYRPEFGRHGKERVTLRHLLTHTVAFNNDPPISLIAGPDWDRVHDLVCDATVVEGREPGAEFRYSTWACFATLGLVVSAVDGRPFSSYVREEVFEPLGMHDCWIGVDPAMTEKVADRMAFVYDTTGPQPEVPLFLGMYQAKQLDSCSPATGGVGPMRQLGRFWEVLLASQASATGNLLRADTIEAMRRRSVGHCGLGLMVAAGYFGRWCERSVTTACVRRSPSPTPRAAWSWRAW
jgi:CubicO group peptidase (beta-lactamase class C family)